MDAQPLGIAEHAADDQNALQVQRHEIALAFGLTFCDVGRVHVGIAFLGTLAAQGAQARYIGNGLNVKYQNRPGHGSDFHERH